MRVETRRTYLATGFGKRGGSGDREEIWPALVRAVNRPYFAIVNGRRANLRGVVTAKKVAPQNCRPSSLPDNENSAEKACAISRNVKTECTS